MKTALQPTAFKLYRPILERHGISFTEEENWLVAGAPLTAFPWALCLTCRVRDFATLLELVLPILRTYQVPFRVVKDELTQYQTNGGKFGYSAVGKVLEIYPEADYAVSLSTALTAQTDGVFSGPHLFEGFRVSDVVYAIPRDPGNSAIPAMPFLLRRRSWLNQRKNRLIGRRYVPYQLIRRSFKGDIFKAISLRNLSFSICLIKQGRRYTAEDQYGRCIIDRLKWQYYVLDKLPGAIPAQRALDFIERDDDAFLILDYIEGIPIGPYVKQLKKGSDWMCLDKSVKLNILGCYLQCLDVAARLHDAGFIHRDLTDTNFVVHPEGTVYLVDFELAFEPQTGLPDPVYVMGTLGYAPPEQAKFALPTVKEDIYSLGSLLSYLVCGVRPARQLDEPVTLPAWMLQTRDESLYNFIQLCRSEDAAKRPELHEMRIFITNHMHNIASSIHTETYIL